MLAPAVSSSPSTRAKPAPSDEGLFHLVAELRATSVASLHALYFEPRFRMTLRGTQKHIARLITDGWLAHIPLIGTTSRYRVVHLTAAGYAAFPSLAARFTEHVARSPTDDVIARGWMRGVLWASLRRDGYAVTSDHTALLAVRRSLIDRQERRVRELDGAAKLQAENTLRALRTMQGLRPHVRVQCEECSAALDVDTALQTCPTCNGSKLARSLLENPYQCSRCAYVADASNPHKIVIRRDGERRVLDDICTGTMRIAKCVPYDVAHRVVDGVHDVILVVVDDPHRSIESQLMELPLRVFGQPRLPVILRHADDGSLWDPEAQRWLAQGTRLRALLRAFTPHDNPRLYPFWESADVLPYRPDLQFRVVPRRRRLIHASA